MWAPDPETLGRTEPNGAGRRYRHGTLTGYSLGKCHCEHCKAAYAHYRSVRRLEGKDDPRRGRRFDTDGHIPRGWFRERVWKPALSAAGIDRRVRIHDLRHAHASWLLSGGADLQVVKERLGHGSLRTTESTSTPCRTLTRPHSMPSPRCVIDEAQDEQAKGSVTPETPSATYRYCRKWRIAHAHDDAGQRIRMQSFMIVRADEGPPRGPTTDVRAHCTWVRRLRKPWGGSVAKGARR